MTPSQKPDMKVTAEDMVEALLNRIAGLEMELASAQVLIRKLQEAGKTDGEAPQGQSQNGSKVPQEVG